MMVVHVRTALPTVQAALVWLLMDAVASQLFLTLLPLKPAAVEAAMVLLQVPMIVQKVMMNVVIVLEMDQTLVEDVEEMEQVV